jgi:hypothetical protein
MTEKKRYLETSTFAPEGKCCLEQTEDNANEGQDGKSYLKLSCQRMPYKECVSAKKKKLREVVFEF